MRRPSPPAAAAVELALAQNARFLERCSRLAGVGAWEWQADSEALVLSDSACELLGLPAGRVPTLAGLLERFGPDGAAMLDAALRRAAAEGLGWDVELRCDAGARGTRVLRIVGGRDADAGGRVGVVMLDVTEPAGVRAELEHALQRLALATHGGGIGVWDLDLTAGRLDWDETMWRLHGEAAHGQRIDLAAWRRRLLPRERRAAARALRAALRGGPPLDGEWRVAWRDGSIHVLRGAGRVLRDAAGQALRLSGVCWDVSAERALQQQLQAEQRRRFDEVRRRASHDGLTGLANRAEFGQRLARCFERARRDGSRHALLALDLDRFKLINDQCGHAAGDAVLREVARRLQAGVRGRDTVARLGGDEFAALLENCSLDEARRVAQKLCDALASYRHVDGGRSFRIGASIGVAPLDGRWPDAETALREADACCLSAKAQGRNRVQLWSAETALPASPQAEPRWAERLQQALDEGRFELDLQRVLPARGQADDGRLRGELLLRLREPGGSRLLPGAFLPAAERFQLAPRIDLWVLGQAVARLERGGPEIAALSLNLAPATLQDAGFLEVACALLERLGAARAPALCLEIAESAVLARLDEAVRFIAPLRALGARIALDDFGSGAAGFGHLKALSVDQLKIDAQFLRALPEEPLDRVALRSFADLGRTLGLATVAKGVETPAQLQALRDYGVDEAQGFALHRPQPLV